MDGRRLAVLWWGGVVIVGLFVLLLVVARLDAGLRDGWLLGAIGVIAVAGLAVVVRTRPRPFMQLSSRNHGDRERGAAVKRVMRGEAVEPASLQAEAIESARRTVWSFGMQAVLQAVVGTCWALQDGGDPVVPWVPIAGAVWIALCIVLLAYTGSRRRRLDAVESCTRLTSSLGMSS